mmetsp:Transcript_3222/g.5443  ORF Transcript_3222/g.5443 Transcript_3222/m.5443 type:complete len:209 (-) Transcript_3222:133-759(-)
MIVGRTKIAWSKDLPGRLYLNTIPTHLPQGTIPYQCHLKHCGWVGQGDAQNGAWTVQGDGRCQLLSSGTSDQFGSWPYSKDTTDGKVGINDTRPIQRITSQTVYTSIADFGFLRSLFGCDSRIDTTGFPNGSKDRFVTLNIQLQLIITRRILGSSIGMIHIISQMHRNTSSGFPKRDNSLHQRLFLHTLSLQNASQATLTTLDRVVDS